MGKRRGSQPPSRGNMTSRGSARRGSLLPDINQRPGVRDDETMYEASYFGGKQKPKKQNLVDEEETADTKKKGKGVDQRVVDKLTREKADLVKRMTVLMQTNKIELEQAKRHAKKLGEDMIEKRLNGCTFVYEEEFEVLAQTFESL
jgi:hypothetical protein